MSMFMLSSDSLGGRCGDRSGHYPPESLARQAVYFLHEFGEESSPSAIALGAMVAVLRPGLTLQLNEARHPIRSLPH